MHDNYYCKSKENNYFKRNSIILSKKFKDKRIKMVRDGRGRLGMVEDGRRWSGGDGGKGQGLEELLYIAV
jgi:hypothetical protein